MAEQCLPRTLPKAGSLITVSAMSSRGAYICRPSRLPYWREGTPEDNSSCAALPFKLFMGPIGFSHDHWAT